MSNSVRVGRARSRVHFILYEVDLSLVNVTKDSKLFCLQLIISSGYWKLYCDSGPLLIERECVEYDPEVDFNCIEVTAVNVLWNIVYILFSFFDISIFLDWRFPVFLFIIRSFTSFNQNSFFLSKGAVIFLAGLRGQESAGVAIS